MLGNNIFATGVGWLNQGIFPPGLNDTVITLIPKCYDHASMKNLRFIALCNVMYKIMAKALMNQLKVVLPRLVSEKKNMLLSKGSQLLIMYL